MKPNETIEVRHDFLSKLRQESIWPGVLEYVAWRKAVKKALAEGTSLPSMPNIAVTSLNLDLTTSCNYACDHCIDWDILNSGIRFEHDSLMATLAEMVRDGLRSVILIGGGEPTLYPKFGEVVRFLKKHGVQVAIVSNGARNQVIFDVADAFTDGDWVRLSLDSGIDETFQRMHRPKKEVTLDEICSWVPHIRAKNPRVAVGFSFIIVWQGAERDESVKIVSNIDEIVTATRLARESGFSYISLKPYLTRHPSGAEVMDSKIMEDFNNTMEQIKRAVEDARELETPEFKVIESTNLRVLLSGTAEQYTNQPRNCHVTAFRQVLTPTGRYHCPGYRGQDQGRIGDARMQSNLIVGGTNRQDVARMIESFDAHTSCAEITCLYNGANTFIEGMIDETIDASQVAPLTDRSDYYL